MGSLAALRRGSRATVLLVFGFLTLFLLALVVVVDLVAQARFGGGAFFLLAVLAFLFILIQWALAPSVVRKAAGRLEPVTPQTNPWLFQTVEEMALKAAIPMPRRIWVSDDDTSNAFVFGRTGASSELVVTAGLLKALTQDEIRAVVAHEVGHLRHRDVMVMTFVSAVPVLAYVLARGCFEIMRRSDSGGKGSGRAVVIAALIALISYVVYLVTQLLVLHLSRTREYYADAFSGAATGDPHALSSALVRISYGLSFARDDDREPSGLRAFMIGDPVGAAADYKVLEEKLTSFDLDRDGQIDSYELERAVEFERRNSWRRANALFKTHPPTYARVLLLGQLEEEMERGGLPKDLYQFI